MPQRGRLGEIVPYKVIPGAPGDFTPHVTADEMGTAPVVVTCAENWMVPLICHFHGCGIERDRNGRRRDGQLRRK